MPPPLQTYNSVLGRTIHNIEQAQGIDIYHATMRDILQAPDTEQADMISLPSTSAGPPPPSEGSADFETALNGLATRSLISDLNSSTALLQNLRLRNNILVADLAHATDSLTRHDEKTEAVFLIESQRRVRWMVAAAFSFALWVVHLWWCWYMRVEFEYIRKRRGDFFGL